MIRELPVSEWPVLPANSILDDAVSIVLGDFIPAHNSTVEFADFFIKRNKKTLFVNIGESWTYGERLPSLDNSYTIGTGAGKYSFGSQLLYSFGPLMTKELDSDLYQYAVPGNSNINMLVELDRILSYVSTLDYEKIYVSLQVTESHRDREYTARPYFNSTPLSKIYPVSDTFKNMPMSYEQWVKMYHSILMDWYQDTLNKYSNVSAIVWSNFCCFGTEKDYTFTHIKPSWIAHSANLLGVEYQEPSVFNVAAIDPKDSFFKHDVIKLDLEWASDQLSKIDRALTFIRRNKYHDNHPNVEGHSEWAKYLLEKSKWIQNI